MLWFSLFHAIDKGNTPSEFTGTLHKRSWFSSKALQHHTDKMNKGKLTDVNCHYYISHFMYVFNVLPGGVPKKGKISSHSFCLRTVTRWLQNSLSWMRQFTEQWPFFDFKELFLLCNSLFNVRIRALCVILKGICQLFCGNLQERDCINPGDNAS